MRVVIRADEHLGRYEARLAALGGRAGTRILTMALNKEGDRGRSQVRLALREQSGINAHQIRKVMKTYKAGAGNLKYELSALGNETNISQFQMKVRWVRVPRAYTGLTMRVQEISAAPWNTRRTFPGAFSVGRYGRKVYARTDDGRGPLKPLYGPNISREMVKAQTREAWLAVPAKVGVEVGRLLGLVMGGQLKLGGRGYGS